MDFYNLIFIYFTIHTDGLKNKSFSFNHIDGLLSLWRGRCQINSEVKPNI